MQRLVAFHGQCLPFHGGSFTSPKPHEVAHVKMSLPFWQMAKMQVGFGEINMFLQSNSCVIVIVFLFPKTRKVALPQIALRLSQDECVTDLPQTYACSLAYMRSSFVDMHFRAMGISCRLFLK